MIDMVDVARAVCIAAYAGQYDRGGVPYKEHPFAVAEKVDGDVGKCVAYLHDVIEDTDVSASDLLDMGFPDEVVDRVVLMTHDEERDGYFEYIANVAKDPIAKSVKLADIAHNTDMTRPWKPTRRLLGKYAKAVEMLGGDVVVGYDE